ncbi:cell division protein FtsW [Rhodococcus sp. WMMA185]|uniref:putative lipid II flippase FtsW n=1 Tax=Rhodococcus sp. WMMA185 TaxID=679318 RepID=UPI000878C718|nr:putative lipid II flippase FtsW [Rhodococcus sp. WMMA185]AOW92836.1 cell division protein FtsW [Rhodococcus sp. WMMA185]
MTSAGSRTRRASGGQRPRVRESAAPRTARQASSGPKTRKPPPRPPRTRIGTWLARPLASFHLVLTIAALLTVLGLVMVLSSSSVEAYASDGSAYTLFTRQVSFAGLGAILFYVALQLPIRLLRRLSFFAFAGTVVLLILVLIPGIGTELGGTRGWFVVAGFGLQPSEVAKIALAVWGAHLLASRRPDVSSVKGMLVPLVPAALVVLVLILLQPDLGTTVSLAIIVLALLWFAGLPLKLFIAIVGTGFVGTVILALTAGYRSARMREFFNPGTDPQGVGYQSRQAMYSLADGGFLGRGLGQSRAKWSYLPNAHNDFIFAIIGEELGYVGGAAVLGLFGLFVYTGLRIAARSVDPFLRLLTGTATVWITGQAFINVGYVIGLLPVTGLQLPLVSAGGTSTATTLFMFGLVANAARHEPEAVAALNAGQDTRFGRLLRKPDVYSPVRAATARAVAVRRAEADRRADREAAVRTRRVSYGKGRPASGGKGRTPERGVRGQRSSGGRAEERGFRR